MIVGQRDYAMRFWVRPDKLAKFGSHWFGFGATYQ